MKQPRRKRNELCFRWVILVLACIMVIGLYYCTDMPAALKPQLERYMTTDAEGDVEMNLGILFSLYSLPNVFIPFFGGYLIDRLGVNKALILFGCVFSFGQVLISLGVSMKSWQVMFAGRFLFGMGGESFIVANSAMIAEWFRGKELALAFGINMAVSRFGSVANNFMSPYLSRQLSVATAFWFGVLVSVVSCVVVGLTIFVEDFALRELEYERIAEDSSSHQYNSNNSLSDRHTKSPIHSNSNSNSHFSMTAKEKNNMTKKNEEEENEEECNRRIAVFEIDAESNYEEKEEGDEEEGVSSRRSTVEFSDVFSFPRSFWLLLVICFVNYGCIIPFNNISASFLLERDFFKAPPPSCHLLFPDQCPSESNIAVDCPSSRWFQPPLPLNFSSRSQSQSQSQSRAIDCSQDEWKSSACTSEYCDRFNRATSHANQIMSIPFLISALLSPPVGYLVDRCGMRASQSLISSAAIVIVHYYLGFTAVSPEIPLIGQGVAYAFFSAVLWSSVPLVVEERVLGFSFGIVTCMQNLGTMIVPMAVPLLYAISSSYIPYCEVLFIVLGIVGVIAGIALNYQDRNNGRILDKSVI